MSKLIIENNSELPDHIVLNVISAILKERQSPGEKVGNGGFCSFTVNGAEYTANSIINEKSERFVICKI